MKEIVRLEDKYLVIKQSDLDDYFSQFYSGPFANHAELEVMHSIPFKTVLDEIKKLRESHGKSKNHYVVLNMADEIDLCDLIDRLVLVDENIMGKICVKNIATSIINSILSAKCASVDVKFETQKRE